MKNLYRYAVRTRAPLLCNTINLQLMRLLELTKNRRQIRRLAMVLVMEQMEIDGIVTFDDFTFLEQRHLIREWVPCATSIFNSLLKPIYIRAWEDAASPDIMDVNEGLDRAGLLYHKIKIIV